LFDAKTPLAFFDDWKKEKQKKKKGMTTPVLETKKRSDSFFNLFLEKDKIFF